MASLLRTARLEIDTPASGTVTLEGFRTTFHVQLAMDDSATRSMVTVYNASEQTACCVTDEGEPTSHVRLFGGYVDEVGLLLDADVTRYRSARQPPEVSAVFECGGAENVKSSTIWVKDYERQTARFIALAIVQELGFTAENPQVVPQATLPTYSYTGTARNALRDLLEPFNIAWTEVGGVVRFTMRDDPMMGGGSQIHRVSRRTGLIGSPEPTDSGAKARVVLRPAYLLGDRVTISAQVASGDYTIVGVTHSGDTHGGAIWMSELELVR